MDYDFLLYGIPLGTLLVGLALYWEKKRSPQASDRIYGIELIVLAVATAVVGGQAFSLHYKYTTPWLGRKVEIVQEQLNQAAKDLQEYRKATGRYPSTDEGLAALRIITANRTEYEIIDLQRTPEHAQFLLFLMNHRPQVLGDAGYYSSWLMPLIYENQQGQHATRYAFSPVNRDGDWQTAYRLMMACTCGVWSRCR